jgi:hypothetical protein
MDIEIKGTAKALDQPHRTGFGLFISKACLAHNVRGNGAAHNLPSSRGYLASGNRSGMGKLSTH